MIVGERKVHSKNIGENTLEEDGTAFPTSGHRGFL